MKSTKIIAGLGVAAALGVAALPVATYAVTATDTVTVSAAIDGSVTITMEGEETTADGAKTGSVNFNTIVAGKGNVITGSTTAGTQISVQTNQPYGYTFSAVANDLENETSTGAKIAVAGADNTVAITNGSDFEGETSIWGIKVNKDEGDLSGSVYNATNFRAVKASTVIDDINNIGTTVNHTYTMDYGIGTVSDQAAGNYSGDIVYTVTCAARSTGAGD